VAKLPSGSKYRSKNMLGQLPLFAPESDWSPPPPNEWPDLRGSYIVGVDTETDDPNLTEKGPGFLRKDAEIIGVSLANDDGVSLYLPLRHVDTENCDIDQVSRYLKHVLGGNEQKVGANLQYDAESLWSMGVELKGPWCDVQVAEALINEERKDGYSLESIAKDYLGDGKEEALLREAALAYSADPKKNMRWIPAKFVAEYAEADALMPIEIFMKQQAIMKKDDLEGVFSLEQKLQPVLWEMRKKGALLDMEKVYAAKAWYNKRLSQKYRELHSIIRRDLNYWASSKVGYLMEELGYENVPTTKFGPSVGNEWLEAHRGDVLCETLLDLRISRKMMSDFIDTFIDANVNGVLHPNWMQLPTEDGGTKSGRMASRRVNLQQIPGRNPVHTPIIRGCFIAPDGQKFCNADFSGQEARISVEVSHKLRIDDRGCVDMKRGRMLTGVERMMQTFKEDPRTDFHNMVGKMIHEMTGQMLSRGPLKNLNFGILYGMGDPKLAASMALSLAEAKDLKETYFKGAPFLKEAVEALQQLASERGFIRTASGRKRRFNRFQAKSWDARKRWGQHTFATEEEAQRELGEDYERAFLHKVFNSVVQGTAADQTKQALVDLYYDHGLVPPMAVHDEISLYGREDEAKVLSHVMETTMARHYGFVIPFIADAKLLDNWGEAK